MKFIQVCHIFFLGGGGGNKKEECITLGTFTHVQILKQYITNNSSTFNSLITDIILLAQAKELLVNYYQQQRNLSLLLQLTRNENTFLIFLKISLSQQKFK